MSEDLPKHLWPRSLQRIAQWCGEQVAFDLWRAYAGTHVHIPVTVTPEHPLVSAVGLAGALKLCERCGGENLLVAKAHKAQLVIRNFMIRKQRRDGATHAELARKHNLHERQILTICNAENLIPNTRQIDLFTQEDNE